MPNKGQKVLTIREKVYNEMKDAWEERKAELVARHNVTTLTGYAQALIERALRAEESEGRFEIINRFENHVMLRDYFLVKDADVMIKVEGDYATVYCQLDRTGKCPHVGFILSDPETIEKSKGYGLVLRRAPKSVPLDESVKLFEKVAKGSEEGEVSEKEFIDEADHYDYDDAEAREMLRDLCTAGEILVTRQSGSRYYFRRASPW